MKKLLLPDILKEHGLTEKEYKKILEMLGREPNLVELGIFSVMWSEHCSYRSSRAFLKALPTEAPCVIQGPGENAGIVDIGSGLAVVFKMESHNHPSYIEPYQGAATGIGGILRDVFTMGARPVALLNSLRFGSMKHPKTRSLVRGVVSGIGDYGNCVGVPTTGGDVYFHKSYDGNCLVNAMAVGVVRKEKIFKGKASGVGNPVMYVGSRTGRDGIHGATMASDVFGGGGEERRPTVQVGDPFKEKLLLEACLEAFKSDYIVGIQDMGAAGLTSSSVEMANRGDSGIELDVSLIPLREEALTPYEIMLSESQERMLLVVSEGNEMKVAEIFNRWGVDARVIGRVIKDKMLRVRDGDRIVAEIPVHSVTEDVPAYKRPCRRPWYQDDIQRLNLDEIKEPDDYNEVLIRLLSSPNLCSRKWIYRQFDYMVRTDTVSVPGSQDASILRIKGTDKATAMTVDCNSRYCYLDPFKGSSIAVAEAARNLVSVGARPMAITDCLNFGNPERPEIMWQFKECVSGIRETCLKFGIPVVSGNVSFYNETSGNSVYPTPTIGMVGLIEDINRFTTPSFKAEGDIILITGMTEEELGGSEYLSVMHGLECGMPPSLNLDMEKAVHDFCLSAIKDGIIKSSHDCSEGGIAVALAECCISSDNGLGAMVTLPRHYIRDDALLFGESQSRIIISAAEEDVRGLMSIADSRRVPLIVIGKVGGTRLTVNNLIDVEVGELGRIWEGVFREFLG